MAILFAMPEGLTQTVQIINQGISDGLHLGAQVYVSAGGQTIFNDGIGQARPGVAMHADSINLWLSAVKPVTAIAVAQQWELGRLRLDDRVVKFVPEFGENGKDAVTIRHLLTHTGGFRAAAAGWSRDPWNQIIQQICLARLEPRWVPGRMAGYHVASGWFMLAEIVRRLDGRMIDRYAREVIFEPLGMKDSWLGMPPLEYARYEDRIATHYNTSSGPPDPNTPPPSAEDCALVRPGGNGRGPIRELGRFYEMLLNGGQLNGARILSEQAAEAIAARHRTGMFDHSFKHVMDWGLGFIMNSNMYGDDAVPYGYGPHASSRTYGHSGAETSCAFCDPEHRLVVAWVCNGSPGDERHQQRQRAINAAIYEDLGLADSLARDQSGLYPPRL